MAILYRIIQKFVPGQTGERKYYAVAKSRREVSVRELAEEIAQESTLSTIDVPANVEALMQKIPQHLSEGEIVRLGDLGSFGVVLKSEGAEQPENITAGSIKGI